MIIDKQFFEEKCPSSKGKLQTEKLIIENGCLRSFEKYISEFELKGKIAAIYDKNTYNAKGIRHIPVDQEIVLDYDNIQANEIFVERILNKIEKEVEVLVAVGAGTIHDLTRFCAFKRGNKFISCPTAASVDGFCSNVAAMTWKGYKKTFTTLAPLFVLADTAVVKNAPERLYKSGIGDIFGKYISLTDWQIGNLLTNEKYDTDVAKLTKEAINTVKASVGNFTKGYDEAYESLMYALLLSGIAMQIVGNSRPASGAEHHFSHLIEIDPAPLALHADALHGEGVGVGTIIMSQLYHDSVKIKDISKSLHSFSLPSMLSLQGSFGELAPVIYEENKDDCLANVDQDIIKGNWQNIINIIVQVPKAAELVKLYRKLGLKTTLGDIGIKENKLKEIVKLSPYMRNRLTFARLLWMIDVN